MQAIVRQHCARHDIPYTERTLAEAAATVIAYLSQVGVKGQDPYTCPLVRRYRGCGVCQSPNSRPELIEPRTKQTLRGPIR